MAAIDDDGERSNHPVHNAAEGGRATEVRKFLDAEPTLLERRDRYGATPLHRAVLGRSRPVVKLLLDRGSDIHARFGADRSPSISYPPQFSEPIDLALWGGARIVRPPQWRNALRCAAFWSKSLFIARVPKRPMPCDVPMARLLLERGADPTWPDADDSPRGAALHNAARMGNRPIVELLLAHGADPNAFVDSSGNAMFVAKTPDIRSLLEAHGGTLDPYDLVWLDKDDEVLQQIASDPPSAHAGCGGVYPAVVTRQKRELLDRLLDAGVTVPPKPSGCHSYLLEQPDMLQKLLQRGGLDPEYADPNGATLLHHLCGRDDRDRTWGTARNAPRCCWTRARRSPREIDI